MSSKTQFEQKLELLRRIENGEKCHFGGLVANSATAIHRMINNDIGDPNLYHFPSEREQEIKKEIAKLEAELVEMNK